MDNTPKNTSQNATIVHFTKASYVVFEKLNKKNAMLVELGVFKLNQNELSGKTVFQNIEFVAQNFDVVFKIRQLRCCSK